jgi:hypothetical protein
VIAAPEIADIVPGPLRVIPARLLVLVIVSEFSQLLLISQIPGVRLRCLAGIRRRVWRFVGQETLPLVIICVIAMFTHMLEAYGTSKLAVYVVDLWTGTPVLLRMWNGVDDLIQVQFL